MLRKGNIKDAENFLKNFDMAKFAINPTNELAMVATEAANDISGTTGMSPEAATVLTAGAMAGGVGLAGLEKFTKGPVKFTDEQLDNFNQMKDDKGNITGYTDSKGNQVANAKGYATDKHGRVVEGGVVKKVAKGAWDKVSGKKSSQIDSGDTLEESTQNSNKNNNTKHHNSSIDHNEPPSSDTKESITENSSTSKSSSID